MSTNGLGYCPCGAGKRHTCNVCGRPLCEWHCAGGPFDNGDGGVELAPVCFPACSAEWWQEFAKHPGRGHAAQEDGHDTDEA